MPRVLHAELAVAVQCELAEGPLWDGDRGLLRWVDILAGRVHAAEPSSGLHTWFDAGDPVGAVGLTASGGLVLALVDGFAVCPPDGGSLTRVPGFGTDRTAVRFNDGKPDPWGNFCAGTMPWTDGVGTGGLYRLTPSGAVNELIGDIRLSNGLDWSDDRRRFFFADSLRQGVDVFATDPATGALGSRQRFLTVAPAHGVPDGLTLDTDGCLWLAVFGSGELRRYTPAGVLDTVVRLPAAQVTSAAFGGADLGTLYITTARENFTQEQAQQQPLAGGIFACTPGVTGRPAFKYAGLRWG
jgi:sugar lactone lactonase YvrE